VLVTRSRVEDRRRVLARSEELSCSREGGRADTRRLQLGPLLHGGTRVHVVIVVVVVILVAAVAVVVVGARRHHRREVGDLLARRVPVGAAAARHRRPRRQLETAAALQHTQKKHTTSG
jgi:hypothetical protein